MRENLLRRITAIGAALALFAGATQTAAAATKGYVLSYFIPAMYAISDDECPHGKNPPGPKLLEQILKDEGKSEAEIKKDTDPDTLDIYVMGQLSTFRGRVDGKPADVFLHPLSHVESLELMVSKYGIGFNLDETNGPNKVVDPLTGETGVNNQMSRILGCYIENHGTPDSRAKGAYQWDGLAWLVAVDGADNLQNADNVEVRVFRALQPVTRGASGIQRNMTYTVDATDPRMQHNTYHGRIKDGLFVSDEPVDFFMVTGADHIRGRVEPGGSGGYEDFKRSHLRLAFKPDGSVMGFLGGFEPIKALYAQGTKGRGMSEFGGHSFPALYQALVQLADTDIDKDSETGMRTRISGTYQFGAVPVFVRFLSKFHTS